MTFDNILSVVAFLVAAAMAVVCYMANSAITLIQ
jgi:hypothetical protein